MTQDEIIALANKAGWDVLDLDDGFGIRLKEFTALVEEKATAAERERIKVENQRCYVARGQA